jgi:nucleoside-diphosphate-sugar epimerase
LRDTTRTFEAPEPGLAEHERACADVLPAPSVLLLGERGLLGSAISRRFAPPGRIDVSAPPCIGVDPRATFDALLGGNDAAIDDTVARGGERQDWIVAAGAIDPRSDAALLDAVNAEAPLLLLQALDRAATAHGRAPGAVRLVTFGSILEDRAEIAAVNPYIRSKARLVEHFQRRRQSAAAGPVAWHHIRLHTLYGLRPPPPFMFLGQMEAALRARQPFAMSAGQQLREYHHAEDVADNVLAYLARASAPSDSIALSSGRAIALGTLAATIFAHFGASDLLRVGAVAAQQGEVFAAAERSPHVIADRDAAEGIIAWLEDIGIRGRQP